MGRYKQYSEEFKRDVLAMAAEGSSQHRSDRARSRSHRWLDLQMAAALSGAGRAIAAE